MAYKSIRMDIITQIKELRTKGKGIKAISRILNISKNTTKKYLAIIGSVQVSAEGGLEPNAVYSTHYQHNSKKKEKLIELLPAMSKRLALVGMTKEIIWNDYIKEDPNGYSYGEFCRQFKNYKTVCNATLNLSHRPGDVMQVDFAGKSLFYYDKNTGEECKTEVLISTLPFSKMLFAIALDSQKTEDFIHGITKSLEYFGGSPKVLLSDNLKSYVTKSDKYSPVFTLLSAQLGAHYEIELDSTRVAKPKDKASVERSVTLAYQNIYSHIHNEYYTDIQQLNNAILKYLDDFNSKFNKPLQMSKKEYFNEFEKPVLRPLPSKEFDICRSTKAKVQKDYHVLLGQDNHYYSVPQRYIGQQTEIVYTKTTVEVFIGINRIAFHKRSLIKGRSTLEQHMPEKHKIYLAQLNNTPQDYIHQASNIGVNTKWAMEYMLNQFKASQKHHKIAEGLLSFARKYSNERLEHVCTYLRPCEVISLDMIKNVLSSNIDLTPQSQPPDSKIPLHDNIRGAKYFA
jgi:transposase